jgi:hypothetical protein
VAGSDILLQAMIQRGYERLASGEMIITGKDLLGALRLQAQFETAQRGLPDDQAWQDAVVTLVEAAKEQLGPERFSDFLAEVRRRSAFSLQAPLSTASRRRREPAGWVQA